MRSIKVVDDRYLALKPKSLSFLEAAALPVVIVTAFAAVFDQARVKPGDFVWFTAVPAAWVTSEFNLPYLAALAWRRRSVQRRKPTWSRPWELSVSFVIALRI